MNRGFAISLAVMLCWMPALGAAWSRAEEPAFPSELVEFGPPSSAPLFAGGGPDAWDRDLRERGWIRREGDGWHLW